MIKAAKKKNNKEKKTDSAKLPRLNIGQTVNEAIALRLREGVMLLLLMTAAYLVLSLYSYSADDPGWFHVGPVGEIANGGGRVGAWLADLLYSLFGLVAWLVPVVVLVKAAVVFHYRYQRWQWLPWLLLLRFSGLFFTFCSGAALAALHYHYLDINLPASTGGVIGTALIGQFLPIFSVTGSTLVLMTILLTGITLYSNLSWFRLMDFTGHTTLVLAAKGKLLAQMLYQQWLIYSSRWWEKLVAARKARQHKNADTLPGKKNGRGEEQEQEQEKEKEEKRRIIDSLPVTKPEIPAVVSVQKTVRPENNIKGTPLPQSMPKGVLPGIKLLDQAAIREGGPDQDSLEAISRQLELKLKDFGVDVTVVAVHPGPVITRYEIQPAPGVKASRITNLASDLARSLAVVSVRVVEVIPGKSVMGIEIPNDGRETVYFSELIASRVYKEASSPLSLALGQDISGLPVVVDLAKMPHLLVAGTTGSGKSVGVNAMLLSMLFKAGPEDVRLIMIDPKMLELSIYDGIPHLLAPVVTDMKEAANALRWCVAEMERRYKLMAALGVRNIAGYNRKVKEGLDTGEPLLDPLYQPVSEEDTAPVLDTLPFIVVVIDEFADMMMIVGKKVEELIARIAQKARAAGIHLILATQRPSVDVITGLIKANVPTRISFQVSSKVDSRTIIDQGGAEQLLGHGDMLYLPPGTSVPIRVHGAFVSDDEVHRVVADWQQRGSPCYEEGVLSGASADSSAKGSAFTGGLDSDSEQDPLYDEAVAFVTESRRASISSVQRKLKIGYNRAARMIESMEAAGVVSPMGSNGNREVMAPAPPKN